MCGTGPALLLLWLCMLLMWLVLLLLLLLILVLSLVPILGPAAADKGFSDNDEFIARVPRDGLACGLANLLPCNEDPPSDPSFRNGVENSELARLWPAVEGRGEVARLLAAVELARRRPCKYRASFSGTRFPVSI
jgi:hypothetical protein